MDRCAAYVDISALLHNYDLLQKLPGTPYDMMAVVKANAYGHGAVEISKSLERHGCKHFGVACLDEAVELREAGIRSEILIFGRTNPEDSVILSELNLTQTVTTFEYALLLSKSKRKINIHINIDTGMSRFGLYCHHHRDIPAVADEVEEIFNLPNLKLQGIYTHFEDADGPDPKKTQTQYELFMELLQELDKRRIEYGLRHACNSAGTIRFGEMRLDMVRCGIALYGYPPVQTDLDLKPVMTVVSKIVETHSLEEGDTISYGAKFTAKKRMKVATVAIGYADGYPRGMTNNDYVFFGGKKCPITGAVCMDAIVVDTTECDLRVDDVVIIFGKEKPVDIIAKKMDTISYEILCNVGRRVHKHYV